MKMQREENFYTRYRLTPFRMYNMAKLALFLKEMPTDSERFSMSHFFHGRTLSSDSEMYINEQVHHYNECGTTACAVGHGPIAGIEPKDRELWAEYSSRCFIDLYGASTYPPGFRMANNLFDWLFGFDQPDCPVLAANRIAHYLKYDEYNAPETRSSRIGQREFFINNPSDWSLLERIVTAGPEAKWGYSYVENEDKSLTFQLVQQ